MNAAADIYFLERVQLMPSGGAQLSYFSSSARQQHFALAFKMSFPVREQSVLSVMGASLLAVLQQEASSCARGARPLL